MVPRPTSWIYYFEDHTGEEPEVDEENLEIPEDFSGVADDQLRTWETELLTTFNAIRDGTEQLSADNLEEMSTIKTAVERVRTEMGRRDQERQELAAKAEAMAAELLGEASEATEETDPSTTEEIGGGDEGETNGEEAETDDSAEVETAVAASANKAPLTVKKRGINVPLSEVQRRAPDPGVSAANAAPTVIVAPDVPNYSAGRYLSDIEKLTDAVHRRAKTLSLPSGRATVATIKREFDTVLDREANPDKVWEVMRQAADPSNLVAAGGWCAPSENIYSFFNIAAEDGMLDIPTVGVQRGGIRFPVSPSIADVFDDPDSVWLWTEQNDEDAVAGTPTKPCVRVPCPDFEEERLDCHGICLTAGNLMDSAFPELIQNYLSLLMAAHRHTINSRIISNVVALADDVIVTGDASGCSVAVDLLEYIDLQAYDYREKYRMSDESVLEAVLPRWVRGALRSDIAKRTGQNEMAVTQGQIMEWFSTRNVRVQFVSDWQLTAIGGATAATTWPGVVEFLLYAAGTVALGAGLDLDLGVIRDSTLNETNDHTAAWTEECNLVAKLGHEVRRVVVPLCTGGCTGALNDFCA